jgi:Skp family chaperone for outer membrane proteins
MAQDARIAVVDLQRLTLTSDEGKAASEKLEKRYQEISTLMQAAQKSIQDKETQLKTQERALSETRKAQLAREIDSETVQFQRKNEDYQLEMAQLEEDVMGPVMDKARAVLAAYLKETSYTILFDISAEGGNIVWFSGANEITEELIKRLNATKTAAPAPASAPQTKPAGNP